ncbi:hypothetical protein N027_00430 [Pseudomonas syringae USA007]|uniref:Metallo-beta-lactamase domain-containing protein n=1 Tax=Pseudomonas syringae USA007 TaxID=1357288 RepID=A0AAU8MA03_PSESX|nr:hypothetical protein [Pseudomonas syringae]
MKGLSVLYNFHPVGQGVFSSGMIVPDDGSNRKFWWVFDCGTHMRRHHPLLDAEINNLAAMIGNPSGGQRPRIDLVFISHFDKDHVNGLLTLLERFQVCRLVLPFIPLYERLLIAFSGKSSKQLQPWQLFITAPSRYIQGKDGIQVDRLTLVPPSGSNGPRDDNDREPQPWGEDPINIVPPGSELPEDIGELDNLGGAGIRIEWLAQGSSLKLGNAWEFVPYNDRSTVVRANPSFTQSAKQLADQLIIATCDTTRTAIKNQIVALYGARHGTTGPEKNLISLFVYSGPLLMPKQVSLALRSPCPPPVWLWHRAWLYRRPQHYQQSTHTVLYTGDGFLKTPEQLSNLLNYFGSARVEQPKVLQVMHHGSKSSWHRGVAHALAPEYSIFCAYEHGLYFHPHGEVWDDFKYFGPWICGEHRWESFRLYQQLRF